MKTPTLTTKHSLLAASLLSIALAVPVAVASAQPSPEPAADPGAAEAARPTPATLTVTATVAPAQCQPVAGGPASVPVTDAAGAPVTPGATPVEHVEAAPTQNPTGLGTSRFDPYTCAPVPPQSADAEAGADATASALQDAPAQVIPSYTPTLNPYPGSAGGISAGGYAESSDPLSPPSTTATIPPATVPGSAPAATTTTTTVVVPAR